MGSVFRGQTSQYAFSVVGELGSVRDLPKECQPLCTMAWNHKLMLFVFSEMFFLSTACFTDLWIILAQGPSMLISMLIQFQHMCCWSKQSHSSVVDRDDLHQCQLCVGHRLQLGLLITSLPAFQPNDLLPPFFLLSFLSPLADD